MDASKNEVMDGRRDRLLAALQTAPTLRAAAEEAGVPYTTARRMMHDPQVQATLADMRKQATREAVIEAANLAQLARQTLRQVMEDAEAAPHARVRAAEVALGYERAITDLFAINERLEAIEARLSGDQAGSRLSETKGTER